MSVTISGSVGQGGVNKLGDVQVVQVLLNRAAKAGLAPDGRCGPATMAAIKGFQKGHMPNPDGRIDVGGKTWKRLIEAKEPPGTAPQPVARNYRNWDRWGDSILNCGSASATGVVIYFSGGTATPLVGAFALNSAALCGMGVGKAIEYDAWQEFQQQGMDESGINAYKVWLTTETLMSLADFCNGLKGAAGFLRSWKEAGKLEKLRKSVSGKKLTRKQLIQLIREIDPKFNPENLKGPGFVSKKKLIVAGQEILAANKFTSPGKDKALKVVDAIGNALTLAGGPGLWTDSVPRTAAVWVVEYQDRPETE